jgi:transglutaminase-like putative cysteine protease
MYTCSPSTPSISLGRIPKGYSGTRKTVEQILRLIREGAKDFCVRQTAIDILFECGVRPKNYLGEIRALFEWVKTNVRYTRDIHRVELLHSPRRMLELRAGDCDDMTILLGTMLKAVGHPIRLALVGFNPRKRTLFTHIYLEAFCRGRWIPLDPTVDRPMGWAPPADHKQLFPATRDPSLDR